MGREILRTRYHAFRQLMTRLAPCAAAASAALLLWHAAHDAPRAVEFAAAPLIYPHSQQTSPALHALAAAAHTSPPAAQLPAGSDAEQANMAANFEVLVGRNDVLDGMFRRMALDTSDFSAMRAFPGIRQSLDLLEAHDASPLVHEEGEFDTRVRTATAAIESSLFQAAEAVGISDVVAQKLATIFAWDVDFMLDIRRGDRFTAVYEQIYQNGKHVRDGDVLAAEFVNSGKIYRALRFVGDAGQVSYYTPAGLPLAKAFLRAPVEFSRVSSGFNPRRMHPILQRIRGHMGIDYAAPLGTPVRAAGNGSVSFEAVRGDYGNAIVLDHGEGISTLYGHLSRFAKHMHPGSRVRQGEVIGYVGMTGLATGPHLHYEYLMNGVHMNPQTVPLPGGEALQADSLRKFLAETAPLLAGLETPHSAEKPSKTAAD